MTVKRWICAVIALLLSITACACTAESPEVGGVQVTPEMLESVSRSLAEQEENDDSPETAHTAEIVPFKQKETAESQEENENISLTDIVYWTESGSVYHIDSQCGSLKNSTKLIQGTVEEALLSKKERACKTCS